MIFKRREKLGWLGRLRDLVAPKKGWRRGFRYIGKRVQRLPDTPHRIAIGFACGVMASFSPFFTLHIFVAVGFALLVRGNLIAAAFGTIFGNPISFPFIAAVSLKTGNWLLGRDDGVENLDALSFEYVTNEPLAFLESIFTPYLIGGLLPGLIASLICYYLMRPVVARFQERRRTILERRARELIGLRRRATRQGQPQQTSAEAAGDDAAQAGARAADGGPTPRGPQRPRGSISVRPPGSGRPTPETNAG